MSTTVENDDDSFIIVLGSSPGASMDVEKCNGHVNGEMEKSQIEDAMKDLPVEANMAFKAQFQLGDSPSPASMMVASTLITDDRSTEELQKRFGELLDENVVLKETLKQNNDSMKEQFMLIASCQEDMLKTHKLHKEKFDETRELVERLRHENKQLKMDISRISDSEVPINSETGESKSGASSGVEFVTSPEDDTIDKLTAQLELVEKQRRQVIVENEKLSWQKESLEHIVDATSKERDDAKEKLNVLELQLSNKENIHAQELQKLHFIINDLHSKLKSSNSTISPEEVSKREAYIQQLESKLSMHQNELKKAQIKILDLENIKLEFTQHKLGVSEMTKMYKDQIQELKNRIKEVQTVVFQPVHVSLSSEGESLSEYASYANNVRIYDRALKHLAQFLTSVSNDLSDSLVHTLGVIASLYDLKLERGSVDRVKAGLTEVKQMIERQHSTALNNISQVRGTLTIFEGIFKDYTDLLKKSLTKQDPKPQSQSVEQLTAALVARGQELQAVEEKLRQLRDYKDDNELLKAQVDVYKSDFEAERDSRAQMASEKDLMAADLRTAQRKLDELAAQMEEIRILSPSLHKSVTAKKLSLKSHATPVRHAPVIRVSPASPAPPASPGAAAAASTTTGNMVYKCPKCMRFSSDQYKVMEDHFDFCLDDF